MSENTEIVAEVPVPSPSFLKRIPVKKVAIVTTIVVGVVLLAKYAKDNVEVVEVPETPGSDS